MNAVLIALFVSSSAQGLPVSGPPAGFDAPAAPVRGLAGKAKQLDAVIAVEDATAHSVPGRPAVHSTGEKKPAFNPAAKRPIA